MKTPVFLMGMAVLFWGWRTGLLIWAVPLAALLELSHWIPAKWEFSIVDLRRIIALCSVLVLTTVIVLVSAQDRVWGEVSFKFFQWLPLTLYPVMLAQAYSVEERMPVIAFTLFLQRFIDKTMAQRAINISHIYFAVVLTGACATAGESPWFFLGIVLLISWALFAIRPRRTGVPAWCLAMVLCAACGFAGQRGLSVMQNTVENGLIRWLNVFFHRDSSSLESRTAIGRLGRVRLSGRIILRVMPRESDPPPSLLREAVYDQFNNNVWRATNDNDFSISYINPSNDLATLLPKKSLVMESRICFLNNGHGLLPLPAGAFELQNLNIGVLFTSPLGDVKVDGGTGLMDFTVRYGPGKSIDCNPRPQDTNVPSNERAVLNEIVQSLHLESMSEASKIQAIVGYFDRGFSYTTDLGVNTPDTVHKKTAISQFLTVTRAGHCEYYATATVLLMRAAGIPARYVTGYSLDESSHNGGTYLVRERDAHAWAMVYHETSHRWEEIDTTPAIWHKDEHTRASTFEFVSDAWSWVKLTFSKWWYSKKSYLYYLRWLLIPLIVFLLWRILSHKRRRQKVASASAATPQWPGLDSDFYLIERRLDRDGMGRLPEEAYPQWTRRVHPPRLEELNHLRRLHIRLRFDPRGLSSRDRRELHQGVQQWLNAWEKK